MIAHRGASALALENTIPAFRRARADGADGVELDVLLCKTGEPVVFHDDNLARLGGRAEAIAELPLAALREARLVLSRDGDVVFSDGLIPTLDEVLDELGPLLVDIELKAGLGRVEAGRGVRLAAVVAELLTRRDASRALVSSFHPLALAAFRRRAPHVATGLLFHSTQPRPLRNAWSRHVVRPRALHPEHVLVDAASLRRWHEAGYLVHPWTVDDLGEARRLADLGVEGLICNDPAAVRAGLG